MIQVRKSSERGHVEHGWLSTYHTFSFADYHDPEHMGFRSLRVINEDFVDPGQGFDTHGHKNMEIITYILSGSLQHKDSMGTGSIIRPGDLQRMSAGKGVLHSEFNPSADEKVHLLQIWILPEQNGGSPSYEQKHFPESERKNQLRLVASRDGAQGALTVHQDVRLFSALLDPGKRIDYPVPAGRHVWVQVARGKLTVNGKELGAGDAAALSQEESLELKALENSEVLVFDLA